MSSPAQIIPFPKRSGAERMLTRAELAGLLGFSERWVAYRQRDGMPSYRYGRSRRYRLSEVQQWLEKREAS